MVVIWDLSPHSAKNVKVKAWRNIVPRTPWNHRRPGVRIIPVSISSTGLFCFSIYQNRMTNIKLKYVSYLFSKWKLWSVNLNMIGFYPFCGWHSNILVAAREDSMLKDPKKTPYGYLDCGRGLVRVNKQSCKKMRNGK